MRKKFILILLLVLSVPSVRELFLPGAYTSHDLTHHIVRTIHMDKILAEGQIPPRWTGDLNFGYGYPLFLFNYPLPQALAAGVHRLGFSYIWSVKLVMAVSMIASLYFAYVLFAYLFRSEAAGIAGGLFYLYAPIRFINIYVSATFGNAVAFAFVPLVFWSIVHSKRGEASAKSLLVGAVSLAGLVLSHNIMALMFIPAILLFVIVSAVDRPKKYYWRNAIAILALGFGISAFFLIPATFERSLIRYDVALIDFYRSHFPTIGQLIHSPWGYGFSHPGTGEDAMSFQIGLAHLFVAGVFLLLAVFRLMMRKKVDLVPLYFLLIFAISVFLTLQVSDFIWQAVPFLPYLQMPWRLLAVAVFGASGLAAYMVSVSKMRAVLAFLLVILVLYANRNHIHINQRLEVSDQDYLSINNSTTMASEHLPKGSDKFDYQPVSSEKIVPLGTEIDVDYLKNTSGLVVVELAASEPADFRFNQVYFPGWQFTIDGQKILPRYKNPYPLPEFSIGEGKHTFRAYFGRTPVRKAGDLISTASLILALVVVFKYDLLRKRTTLRG